MALDSDRFLLRRGKRWHYQRRVPSQFAHVDGRRFARVSLKTESLKIARLRRNHIAEADDKYWMSLAVVAGSPHGIGTTVRVGLEDRYKAAILRAMAYGFSHKSAGPPAELKARIQAPAAGAGKLGEPSGDVTNASPGGPPGSAGSIRISEAFDLYVRRLAIYDQYNKSEAQRRSWEKSKRTSIRYFIEQMGDLRVSEITRDKALEYREWWLEQMRLRAGKSKPITPNTANRHIGNMRSLLECYFRHIGVAEFEDPFRGFYFPGKAETSRASFSDDWVRTRILVPGLFNGLRLEFRVLIYLLIETGARLSELVNLRAEDIRVDARIPHIAIRPESNRELQTEYARRDIPLVGIAEILS